MNDSEVAVLELGCALVRELELEATDTLGRWMAHHVAELMRREEQALEQDKVAAQEACREAIITLWKHRAALPRRAARLGRLTGLQALLRRPGTMIWEIPTKERPFGDIEGSELWLRHAERLGMSLQSLRRVALKLAANVTAPEHEALNKAACRAGAQDADSDAIALLLRWSRLQDREETDWVEEVQSSFDLVRASKDAMLAAVEERSRMTKE